MYRKSLRTMIMERKRVRARLLVVAKARKRMATPVEPWTFAGIVRASGPAFGCSRQVALRTDGERVCVDGAKVRTLRGFAAAMNRKLYGRLTQ